MTGARSADYSKESSNLAPIVVTVYSRLEHLKACIESLGRNDLAGASDLYVVSDAATKKEHIPAIDSVRAYIKTISGFNNIFPVFRESNLGAYRSTKDAIDRILEERGRIIFLEDDMRVSKTFLRYMNDGLSRYNDDPRILAICAYSLPFRFPFWYRGDVYLGKRFSPWGFGAWREKWGMIDFSKKDRYSDAIASIGTKREMLSVGADFLSLLEADSRGRIEANDVRVCYHQLINNLYCVFPRISQARNAGFDGSGEHCGKTNRYDVELDERDRFSFIFPGKLVESKAITRRFANFQNERDILPIHLIKRLKHLVGEIIRTIGRKN
jgi:hypothetical protein